MTVNDILDKRFEIFKNNQLTEDNTVTYNASLSGSPDNFRKGIDKFYLSFENLENQKYIILKIIDRLNEIKFTTKNETIYASYDEYSSERFTNNIFRITSDLMLKLNDLGFATDTEIYDKSEFEELLTKIDKIAESIFIFQQKSDIANEIMYDSIDEIKEQLKNQAEKGKIFGKEFVEQQLAGKIMDMAFKGSFFAMLSHAPEQISDIANHVKGLL